MKQYELARVVGVNPSHISQIELGRRAPSLDTLVLIAEALQQNLWRLIRDAETGGGL